ncbi:MAG: hypothetical protein ACMUJM_14220 [bacterium]
MCKQRKNFLIVLFIFCALILASVPLAEAQNWVPMPPYNVLWPLWSSLYSPPDVTGTPTPLITELTSSTILPMQPMLVYDPDWWTLAGPNTGWPMGFQPPWLIYNGPTGVLFFDTLYGINSWPPDYMIDSVTGAPAPITLAAGFSLLDPTPTTLPTTQAIYLFELANLTYMLGYGNSLGINPLSLVTAAQAFGLPPL